MLASPVCIYSITLSTSEFPPRYLQKDNGNKLITVALISSPLQTLLGLICFHARRFGKTLLNAR